MYKFISNSEPFFDIVRSLLQGEIKFSLIHELNDPTELIPSMVFDDVRKSRERLLQDGFSEEEFEYIRKQERLFQRLAPECQVVPAPASREKARELLQNQIFDREDYLKSALFKTAKIMTSRIGVFCLSRRYDSFPMWAHYASNAKGLVVEFRNLNKTFSGDNTGILREPVPIRYERGKIGVTFDPKSHESLFFCKLPDWSYEREVRIILPLDECCDKNVNGKTIYVHKMRSNYIARLILGWKMTSETVENVRQLVSENNSNVEVVQARIGHDRIEF